MLDHEYTLRRTVQKVAPYTPWRYFSDGCNPDRDIGTAINQAGFSQVQLERYMQAGEGLILEVNSPHIYGTATKSI